MPPNVGRNLPNARLHRLLLALEAEIGRGGLMTLLRQARLQRYTAGTPGHNREARVLAAEYAGLIQAVETYYGRGARGTLVRVGQRVFEQLLRLRRVTPAWLRLTNWLLSRPARAARTLRWVAAEIAAPAGRVEVLAEGEHLVVLDYEGDSAFGRQRELPGCWLLVGELQQALYWATGQAYEVIETECKSAGAPACRFEARPAP